MRQLSFDFNPAQQICICGRERKQPTQPELIEFLTWSVKKQLAFWDRRNKWFRRSHHKVHYLQLVKTYSPFHWYIGEGDENRTERYGKAGGPYFLQTHGCETIVKQLEIWTAQRAMWVENVTRDDLAKHFTCNYFANGFLTISHDGKNIEPTDEITTEKKNNLVPAFFIRKKE
jgi:hypothetical protein